MVSSKTPKSICFGDFGCITTSRTKSAGQALVYERAAPLSFEGGLSVKLGAYGLIRDGAEVADDEVIDCREVDGKLLLEV